MNPPWVYKRSPSWTLLPPPSPYHPSGSSQCTSPEHPVSCIKPGLAIHFTYDIIHVSMPFSQIIPPSPSPTESKRLFYTSVSLLLSRIQSYHYYLSKFHIYALVYCICVFLSLNVSETCFTRLLNLSISWGISNYKTSKALSTQKTGWSSSLPLLLPQEPPSYQVTSAEHHTHPDSTALHTPKHHKTRRHGKSAGSLEEWELFL